MLYIWFIGSGGYGGRIDRVHEHAIEDASKEPVSIESARDNFGIDLDRERKEADSEPLKSVQAKFKANGSSSTRQDGCVVKVEDSQHPLEKCLQIVEGQGARQCQCRWCGGC